MRLREERLAAGLETADAADAPATGAVSGRALGRRFVIQPNPPAGVRLQTLSFLLLAALSLGIAAFFYQRGLPLILPFSGLELAALAAILVFSTRRARFLEVVTVTPDFVRVERGRPGDRSGPAFCWQAERSWTRVVLRSSQHPWYPSRLLLLARGSEVEIGKCLCEPERRGLARAFAGRLASRPFSLRGAEA